MRFQYPNPVDLLYFAADEAARRIGLPGPHVHIHLELRGRLDLEGFRRALAALYRRYPAVGARRDLSMLTGRPRWRLGDPAPDLRRVLRVHTVGPATETQLHRQIEQLFTTHLDSVNLPPVHFHIFRGLPRGDVLVMRWSHALMDARGGFLILEALDRLFHRAPDPNTVSSAGDELRDDFARILAQAAPQRRAKMVLERMTGSGAPDAVGVQLDPGPLPPHLGPMRYLRRYLTPAQTHRAHENSRPVLGSARFSDFLRACAIRAFHHLMPKPLAPGTLYTMKALINHRNRRQGAVCWNLINALPIAVPARLAEDRALVAKLIRRQMAGHLAAETAIRQYAALRLLTRLPTAWVAALLKGDLSARRGAAPLRPSTTPSLLLGVIGPFSRPMSTFCGVELLNYYSFGAVQPRPGLLVDVNVTEHGLNVTGVCFESWIGTEILATLLDRFVAELLEPR